MRKITHLVWDWNGTLFDDVELNRRILNHMLEKRGLAALSLSQYREIFDFPIVRFYEAAGFDLQKERFEALCVEYIDTYQPASRRCGIARGAPEVMRALHGAGVSQRVLSASRRDLLLEQVGRFAIGGYLDDVLGLDNIAAVSKAHLARGWLAQSGADPAGVLFVGDTVHDYETARAQGCGCVLMACGHQSASRLAACGVPVLGGLRELLPLLQMSG